MSVGDFYDGLAQDYHLIYPDWHGAVDRQGAALDRLIREELGSDAVDVLDCSCGIGTQAIGLARCGYRVHGTDISPQAIDRARVEAGRLETGISFEVADFRDLTGVQGMFDVVLSCDNAIPHLLEDDDVGVALSEMKQKLRPGGLLIVSVRDYDQTIINRPKAGQHQLIDGPPRRYVFSLYDWETEGPIHTLHLFIAQEGRTGWELKQHHTRYRALAKDELSEAVREAGFADTTWHTADEVGFHQPVLTAREG